MLGRLGLSRFVKDSGIEELERRVNQLEAQLEGLQDAVHRDAVRRDEREARLERRTDPQQMARSLSRDARSRGL
jgi:hypothetical protein